MQSKKRWQELRNAAWQARRNGEFDQAEKYLMEAIREAKLFEGNAQDLQETLNTLANFYAEQGRIDEAVEIAREIVRMHRHDSTSSPVLLANDLMFLAHVLVERGDVAEAILHAAEGVPLYEQMWGFDHSETQRMREFLRELTDKTAFRSPAVAPR